MNFEKLKQEILEVLDYRRGDFYVGSHAVAVVCHELGSSYPCQDMKVAIDNATDYKIRVVHEFLLRDIEYMKAHPMEVCPHCGQLMDKEE